MPIVAVSLSRYTHSWVGAYRRDSGSIASFLWEHHLPGRVTRGKSAAIPSGDRKELPGAKRVEAILLPFVKGKLHDPRPAPAALEGPTFSAVPGAAWLGSTYPMAILFSSVGEKVPLVTCPAGEPPSRSVNPSRAIRLPSSSNPTRFHCLGSGFCRHEGVAPDEIAFLQIDRKTQTGLKRIGFFIKLVAVERHPRLKPQRVARAQPGRPESPGLPLGQ